MAIINDELTKDAQGYKAPDTTPVTTEVDYDTETVEGRMNNLNKTDSKYTQMNIKDAQNAWNDRGLVNSSMAAGSGVEAGIKSSFDIASKDAPTYTKTRLNNQDITNQFLENRQSTDLNKESAAHESGLTRGEMTLQSDLKTSEMETASALTNEENTLLNELTMKRDEGLSALTQTEMATLKDLEIKRDLAASKNRESEINTQSTADIARDTSAAAHNTARDQAQHDQKILEMVKDSELRTEFEKILQSDKFSDEAKMNILTTMNNVIRDAQAQITQIGTSDRTATQQAAAIAAVETNRDSTLAAYEKILGGFEDWEWSTQFTPNLDYEPPPDGGNDDDTGGNDDDTTTGGSATEAYDNVINPSGVDSRGASGAIIPPRPPGTFSFGQTQEERREWVAGDTTKNGTVLTAWQVNAINSGVLRVKSDGSVVRKTSYTNTNDGGGNSGEGTGHT